MNSIFFDKQNILYKHSHGEHYYKLDNGINLCIKNIPLFLLYFNEIYPMYKYHNKYLNWFYYEKCIF